VSVNLVNGAFGDLNADGTPDAAAVLAVNTGGSGTFMLLLALSGSPGELSQSEAAWLGDRVKIDSLSIQDGKVLLEMTTHAADDPMCCPSLETNRVYTLIEGRLLDEDQTAVSPLSAAVLQVLKDEDIQSLASFIHPQQGLRFSPYATVLEDQLVFTPSQLIEQARNPQTLTWGTWDGSGGPIEMSFADYFQRFVYSKDFSQADQVSFDRRVGQGNSLDNSQEFYPGAQVVEYYISGKDPNYGGMDWQSLRLVFQQLHGRWYLSGIIHDEWTI